jgi:small GTP-binding protein
MRVGNFFRGGKPVSYRKVLTKLVEKYDITTRGRKTISGMEAAIALDVLNEHRTSPKGSVREYQLKFPRGLEDYGYNSTEDISTAVKAYESGVLFYPNELVAVGVGLGNVMSSSGLLLSKVIGVHTDLDRARMAVAVVFSFRLQYQHPRNTANHKSSVPGGLGVIRIALIGRVSSGKSSTINAILGHNEADVSPLPGSTSKIKGFRVTNTLEFIDTPGLEDAKNPKWSAEAINCAQLSDLVLFIVNAQQVTSAQKEIYGKLRREGLPCLVVLNKMDTIRGDQMHFADRIRKKLDCPKSAFFVGALDPRTVNEWDSASTLMMAIVSLISREKSTIQLNREVIDIIKSQVDQLDPNNSDDRHKIAGLMQRLDLFGTSKPKE